MDYDRSPEASVLFVLNYTKYITDKARKIWLEVGYLVFSCRFRKRVSDVDVVVRDTNIGLFSVVAWKIAYCICTIILGLARDGALPLDRHVFLDRLRVPPTVSSA